VEGASRCVATSMCYVQYLDRGDGASPWSRGCIDGIANSLLCENQPPAAVAAGKNAGKSGNGKRGKWNRGGGAPLLWPLIHCCSSSFCNSEEFSSSYPVWMKKKFGKNETSASNSLGGESSAINSYDPTVLANNNNDKDDYNNHFTNAFDADSSDPSSSSIDRNDVDDDEDSYFYYQPKVLTFGDAVNPIYVAVPAVGACILLLIVLFAFYLLRKHSSGGVSVGGAHRHRGVGGAPTPSLLSSSPFLFVDHQSQRGASDCGCESSSSSSSLYCHHDLHQQHHQQRNNPSYSSPHPSHHSPPPSHPPKYDEAFLAHPPTSLSLLLLMLLLLRSVGGQKRVTLRTRPFPRVLLGLCSSTRLSLVTFLPLTPLAPSSPPWKKARSSKSASMNTQKHRFF